MRSAVLLFALATLATLVLAAPTPANTLAKRSFAVPVASRGKLPLAEAMARAYRKFGWEIIVFGPKQPAPTTSTYGWPNKTTTATVGPTATSSGNDGDVTATPEKHDQSYNSPVTIGGQTLNLDFDTGSSDLWVFSTGLPSDEDTGHTLFNPSQSSTWTSYTDGSWSITYGDNSYAKGSVGFDTINVGGAVVQKQCVELADDVSASFLQNEKTDGLLGLGFSSINQVKPRQQKTFFANVMDTLDQPLFTVDLGETSGTYEFGTIDTTKYTGDIHYTPVDNSNGWWQFDSNTYTIDGRQQHCTMCNPAIADTGTTMLLVDDDIAQRYYAQVKGATVDYGAGGYVFECDTALPDFGVAIGNDYTATIKGSELVYAEIDKGVCVGSLQGNGASSGEGAPVQVYGDAFLKHFFVVFDGGEVRLGIAEQA